MNATETRNDFVISRVFDAPRELVWKVHTDCEHLKHWWGPKGFKVTVCKLDLRPGGFFLYCLRDSDGPDMWGKFTYRDVVAPEQLGFIVTFSDAKGGVTRHPMSPTWPLEMLSTVTFTEQGSKTKLAVRWLPHNATEEERRTFDAGHDAMLQGWGGTLDQLAEYLAKA